MQNYEAIRVDPRNQFRETPINKLPCKNEAMRIIEKYFCYLS